MGLTPPVCHSDEETLGCSSGSDWHCTPGILVVGTCRIGVDSLDVRLGCCSSLTSHNIR